MSTSLFPVPSLSPFDGSLGLSAFLGDLSAMWNYCMANDVFVSRSLESQQSARDLFDELLIACNCAPVFSEGMLKSIPWSEVSCVGNGVIFTAPTSAGPLFDFDETHFITDAGAPPLKVTRPRLSDVPNIVSVEYINRDGEYNTAIASATDDALIAQFGPIKAEPKRIEWIHDSVLATKVAWLLLRKQSVPRRTYSFRLPPHFGLLEPMDLITVSVPAQRIWRRPVRLTAVNENEKNEIECEAEDYIYGSHSIITPPIVSASGSAVATTNTPGGAVNVPIIFEALPAMLASGGLEVWAAVSGADPNYGGCHVWVSTDGGSSYQLKGTVVGSAVTGYTTADFPGHSDPDTSDALALNLAESKGTLGNFTAAQEDLLESLFVVTGGGYVDMSGTLVLVPYEIGGYETAALTGANQWSLATRLRRGLFNSGNADHPIGSQFAYLGSVSSPDNRIFRLPLDAGYIGQTIYFKFTAFNSFGSGEQSLALAVPYTFTIGGFVAINFADKEAPPEVINSSNTAFTLAHTPSPADSAMGFLVHSGVPKFLVQGVDYTLAGAAITYTVAPATGDTHFWWYRY